MTRRFVRNIYKRYEFLYGSNKQKVIEKSMKLTFILLILYIVEIALVFFTRPSLLTFATAIFLTYVLNIEIINISTRSIEIKLLKQMEDFITTVKHNFYVSKNVLIGVWEAIDTAGKELKPHVLKIYDVLSSDELENSINEYNEKATHKYLKMFLSLSSNIMVNGDTLVDGSSVLTNNLIQMKDDIHTDLREIKRSVFLFSGATFLIVLPLILMPLIKSWALVTFPEVKAVYNSVVGVWLEFISFLLTLVIYNYQNDLKERNGYRFSKHRILYRIYSFPVIKKLLDNYVDRNYGKSKKLQEILKRMGEKHIVQTLKLKQFIVGTGIFFSFLILVVISNTITKKNLLTKVDNVQSLINIKDDKTIKSIEEYILLYVNEYKNVNSIDEDYILQIIEKEGVFESKIQKEAISQEVIKRIGKYRQAYLNLPEIILSIIFGIIAFWYPYLMILYRQGIILDRMKEEVQQFQKLIYMQMHMDGIDPIAILSSMETFASIFRKSIQKCINDYRNDDEAALRQLKKDESYPPFLHIVDSFLMISDIGIQGAFDEISSEIKNFKEDRRLDAEILLEKRVQKVMLISLVPFIFVLLGYLMAPLIYVSLSLLKTTLIDMQSF